MKRLTLLFVVVLALVLVSTVMAQEPGEGGVVTLSSGSDVSNLNPLVSSDGTSLDAIELIYPTLFSVDSYTGAYTTDPVQGLAVGWEFNEDGTVLIIHLREDAFWSDGVQITAHDYIWGVEALRSNLLDTSRSTQMWETLDDGTQGSGSVADVVALDDFTLEVTFARANCLAMGDLATYVLPSHIYEEDFGDDLAAMNDDPLYLPGVTFGAWTDMDVVIGDRVSALADTDYADAQLGFVSPGELEIITVPDGDIELERFRAGEITYLEAIDGEYHDEFENDPNFQTNRWQRLGYAYMTFNMADPDNPQSAYDADGNLIDQDPHPILSDVLVRRALTMAYDIDAVIENNLGGAAVRVGQHSIPISWDWNPDLLYPFDPAAAEELLEEAGWSDTDGDGVRECVSCAYLEVDPSYAGTPMELSLIAPLGNGAEFEDMMGLAKQGFEAVGASIDLQYLDWGSDFLPSFTGQTYDIAWLTWGLSIPIDPDARAIFGSTEDNPETGAFNTGSYINLEVDQLYDDALDPTKTDGCTVEGRNAIYQQIHQIIHEDAPYLFMYSNLRMSGVQGDVQNWEPAPFNQTWQVDAWDMTP